MVKIHIPSEKNVAAFLPEYKLAKGRISINFESVPDGILDDKLRHFGSGKSLQ